jgi:hypothetical protein
LKTVAVVVPLSNRNEFTPEEEISLGHLKKFLGRYDKYFVIPRSLKIESSGFGIKRFDEKFFGTVQAHTRLMFSPTFYRTFADYEYILIYHLDSLVFSDQLVQWCEMGFDYIGSPWIKSEGAPYLGPADLENQVGNGGFSLRKVESFLKVIYSPRYSTDPMRYWEEISASTPGYRKYMRLPKFFLKHLKVFNSARREISKYPFNEDMFWATRARHLYPEFKIAPLEVALRFAFECAPRACFEKNNHTLPFGCHAWPRYDREFWEPYLLK